MGLSLRTLVNSAFLDLKPRLEDKCVAILVDVLAMQSNSTSGRCYISPTCAHTPLLGTVLASPRVPEIVSKEAAYRNKWNMVEAFLVSSASLRLISISMAIQ